METVHREGIQLLAHRDMQVTVANGDRIGSSGLGHGLPLEVGNEKFAIDCYAIPLDEFDLVLGVQWLETLGPILWDLSTKTMAFWHGDHKVTWHGLGSKLTSP